MYRLHRSPTAPDKIYSSSLKRFCLGHGMWYPEPHMSGETQIGDVGFLKDGAFIRLFNLDTSAPDKKVTYWRRPFDVSDPPTLDMFMVDERKRPIAPRPYRSHGVQSQRYHASASLSPVPGASAGIDAEYTCKASQGAVLALKSEAQEQTIFENLDLKQYVLQHHESWCTYVRDVLRLPVKPAAIVMVSGWVKTGPDWAVAAFSSSSSSTSASLKGGVGGSAGAGAGGEHTSSEDGSPMHREGEQYAAKDPEPAAPRARDQSIFIKRFKVRRRLGIVRTVVAGAGYHRLPRGDGRHGGDENGHVERGMDLDEGVSEPGEVPDLVDILLDYMFETTAIETAVASDDDVACIVGEDSFEDFANYLRARQPPVEVDGRDTALPIGFLSKERIIRHQRERDVARRTITKADWAQWPNISLEGASKLDNIRATFGSTAVDAHPVKLHVTTFVYPQHPSQNCYCFALSPDGTLLAASFETSSIFLWRLKDGAMVQRLRDEEDTEVICLEFSPDGRELLFGARFSKMATAWNIRTRTVTHRIGPHIAGVTAITRSPSEPYIVTGEQKDGFVNLWDIPTGACLARFGEDCTLSRIVKQITFLPMTVDASNVYVRHAGGPAYIFNYRTKKTVHSIEHLERKDDFSDSSALSHGDCL
ncbi:hypothetical protein PsYK624_134640 [Phanerochaete sordida]|uniref:WD40 repeat-like protein n=1 Tax=Phanerochaete sordida TaxID=48140 RepID=A0A9P3GJV9_9APHY|nr:hypothetical protein PsYK624_134640 [Phanerochaete sordida]